MTESDLRSQAVAGDPQRTGSRHYSLQKQTDLPKSARPLRIW